MFDDIDNCPDTSNTDQLDADGDAAGDVCDSTPNYPLEAQAAGSNFALAGHPRSTTYRLIDRRTGRLMSELTGVRVTLTIGGSAVFGTAATHGVLLGGGGTNRALVEFAQGVVTLDIVDATAETVTLGGEDTEQSGVVVASDVVLDFELNDGAFVVSGYEGGWQWGPGHPASGENGWQTQLPSSNQQYISAILTTPRFPLALGSLARLEFQNWFGISTNALTMERCKSPEDSFASWTTVDSFHSSDDPFWRLKSYDVSAFAGSNIQVRFFFNVSSSYNPYWAIDDFAIQGAAKRIEFLASPEEDIDGDGLTNAREVGLDTDARDPDTDDDELSDGVEVDRYQTDPLNSDTDRGGIKDGTEVYQGTNPLDPVDDNKPEFGMVLQDYSGPTVIESHTRTNLGSVYLQSGPNYGDCVMSPDGALGFATDSNGHIWIVDPAASPPERASGTNPIPLSVPGGDLAATSDGRFLVACGGYPSTAISVVDTASRAEIGTVELNAYCSAVDVCRDGSVLIATAFLALAPLHHRCGRTPRRHRRRRRCPGRTT